MPLQNSPGYWTVGRTSQGYLGAAQTKDPTAAGGWSTTGDSLAHLLALLSGQL
jgi:hypothetical protein|eukprot:COSAG01_NODE_288_length_19394_cov_29.544960_7_plen_53_part_00